MCGIVGYVGYKDVSPLLLGGLKRLEYRGYDSAGIAVRTADGKIVIRKSEGKLSKLVGQLNGARHGARWEWGIRAGQRMARRMM